MSEAGSKSRGRLVATALAGAWRPSPPPLEITARDLDDVAPLLLGSGAGALGWWRVRHSDLGASPVAANLQEAYRLLTLEDALHERTIKKVVTLVRSTGVEPLLIKGWVSARLYAERALRPYGDIDLCVRPGQFGAAREALSSPEAKECWVDLHQKFTELEERSLEELYARSQLVELDDVRVRVMGPEDHFALLAIHWLKHGAWRPLWLCDVGAALESLPANFDWELCLGRNPRRANWITCVIVLAHQLLDADISQVPAQQRAKNLPKWLIKTVLKQWGTPYAVTQEAMKHYAPMATYLRHPSGVLRGLLDRWPNPIQVTIDFRAPLNEFPRLPLQLGDCFSRAAKFLMKLPRSLHEH